LEPASALEDVKEKRKQTGLFKEKEKHSVISESTDDQDYLMLLDKMMTQKVEVTCTERLLQKSNEKRALMMPQRRNPLTQEEAKAAMRLAKAMEDIGCDEFGLYSGMAKSLKPRQSKVT
jgi:hypothetical protein